MAGILLGLVAGPAGVFGANVTLSKIENRASVSFQLVGNAVEIGSNTVTTTAAVAENIAVVKSGRVTGGTINYSVSARPDPARNVAPVDCLVDAAPQKLFLLQDPVPAGTSFQAFTRTSAGARNLYHLKGTPARSFVSTRPANVLLIDTIAAAAPGFTAPITLEFSVRTAAGTATVTNTAVFLFKGAPGASDAAIASNTITLATAAAVLSLRSVDADFTHDVTDIGPGDLLYFLADLPGLNVNPAKIDTAVLTIRSSRTGDVETVQLVETGPNTGVFRSAAPLRTALGLSGRSGDGILTTLGGDTLLATVVSAGRTLQVQIAVHAGWIVFDSATGQPIAGARVTLIDASTGFPPRVSVPGFTGTVITGSDGQFSFPGLPPGSYRLQVTPPPGYLFPSNLAQGSFPKGRTLNSPGSFGGEFQLFQGGTTTWDIPLDPLSARGAGLLLEKTASRLDAEVGDFVDYTLQVKNVSGKALESVRVEDRLPIGFKLQKNSATVRPSDTSNNEITWLLPALASDATVVIRYRCGISAGAQAGNGINKAVAKSLGKVRLESNVAQVKVTVKDGVFTGRGTILGKIFLDENRNRLQERGEPGIPGVRIYMEDGSYVISDAEGKYSFAGVSPVTHVLKVDETTLPPGAHLEALTPRFAGDPGSQFVQMPGAGSVQADFALIQTSEETRVIIARMRAVLAAADDGETALLKAPLTRQGETLSSADPRSLPASGVLVPGVSVQPTQQTRTESAESFLLGGARGEAAQAGESFTGAAPRGAVESADSTSLEKSLERAGAAGPVTFLDLKDGDTLSSAQIPVRVRNSAGGTAKLKVNGQEVGDSRVGKHIVNAQDQSEASEYIGVQLRPGKNTLELVKTDPFGNPREHLAITVTAPDKLGRLVVTIPESAVADGKSPAIVRVRLEDGHGVLVTARTQITLESTLGGWLERDLNPAEPGLQVFLEGGQGEYRLAAPAEPGEGQVRVSCGTLTATGRVTWNPYLRPLLAAGVVEAKFSTERLSFGGHKPSTPNDPFGEQLNHLADGDNLQGRTAFFMKGKLAGEVLLTASYDSEKERGTQLFRDIQPDEFYPVYGDSAIKGFEAQSTSPLYVRLDQKQNYALYGDFVTQGPGSGVGTTNVGGSSAGAGAGLDSQLRQLGAYQRSLTGFRAHYESRRFGEANAWAVHDSAVQVVQELPGNGTSGPYLFSTANGLQNSERVEILTRDRNQRGLVLESKSMTRFSDYEFEPVTGRILFKAPVPTYDENFNLIYIRVTYEVDQGGPRFWTYGADALWKAGSILEAGGAFVREENPLGAYQLESAQTRLHLGAHAVLDGEWARSEEELLGRGDAYRGELRYEDGPSQGRLSFGHADANFHNPTALLENGRTEGQLRWSQQLDANTRLLVHGLYSEGQNSPLNTGIVASIEETFAKDLKFEIGARYSHQDGGPTGLNSLSIPLTLPNGVRTIDSSADDIRSLRARLTVPVPLTEGRGRAYAEYEQDVVQTDQRVLAFGGDYQVDARTKLYVRDEVLSSLITPFQVNEGEQQHQVVAGVESTYMKDASLFNEYRLNSGLSGREAEVAVGLRNQWDLSKYVEGLKASTTFERVSPLASGRQIVLVPTGGADRNGRTVTTPEAANLQGINDEATAATLGLEYLADDDWKASGRLEWRQSPETTSVLQTAGLSWRPYEDWTFLGKELVYVTRGRGESLSGDGQEVRLQLGAAWRPTENNRWSALFKI